MSLRPRFSLWLLATLSLALPVPASARPLTAEQAAASLPQTLTDWMFYEQKRIDRSVDPQKIRAPDIGNQAVEYRPDTGKWFPLPSVWIPEEELKVADLEDQLPDSIRADLVRTRNGKEEYRFFIHPESREFHRAWLEKYPESVDYWATSTSSSRSMLVRSKNRAVPPFFAKVSLAVELGGSDRTIPNNEIVRSVGSSKHMLESMPNTSGSLGLVPEVLGVAPKDGYRGGQIIRLVPDEVMRNERTLVPLFSLYAEAEGGALIDDLARRSNTPLLEFAQERILKPYIRAWAEWSVNHGITGEDHAQNLLLELDAERLPTGRFFRRDGGGFYINPRSPSHRLNRLRALPTFTGFHWDYQKFALTAETRSLETYFVGGFLYNLGNHLEKMNAGITRYKLEKYFWAELSAELARVSGLEASAFPPRLLKTDMSKALQAAREAALKKPYRSLKEAMGRPLRVGFYTGTFDPPHAGHLELVEGMRQRLGLDIVYVLPNPSTPHKPEASPYPVRKRMAELAFIRDGLRVADPELSSTLESSGPDGAIRELLEQYGEDAEIYRIMGDDTFNYYAEHPDAFTHPRLKLAFSRRAQRGTGEITGSNRRIGESSVVEVALEEKGHSSTQIRNALARGESHPAMLPDVFRYIHAQGLYGAEATLFKRARGCVEQIVREAVRGARTRRGR